MVTTVSKDLMNYWPIKNDLRDYIGYSDMSPGTNLEVNGSVSFGPDRFGNPNGAIYLNHGYYTVPDAIYFSGSFSILAWIKLVSLTHGARLIDFGTPTASYCNVVVQMVSALTPQPCFFITDSGGQSSTVTTGFLFDLNKWYHIGAVLNGTDLYFYIDGVLQGSRSGLITPPNYMRQNCYFGRSAWHGGGDYDADAYFDEIKFYSRALTQAEVQNDMNIFNSNTFF